MVKIHVESRAREGSKLAARRHKATIVSCVSSSASSSVQPERAR